MAFKCAETLCFVGRKLHTTGVIPEIYRQWEVTELITRQKYYSWNCAGMNSVRVESTCVVGGMNLTTVFIKNKDGIWDALPQCVAEVSVIFKRDQLLGTFPFFRFFLTLQYPYELNIDESHDSGERLVVTGRLMAKPPRCEEDIASEFSYTINSRDGHLCSLREKTFAGRSLHLELDSVEINRPISHNLFELPDRQKMVMANLEEYVNLRNSGMDAGNGNPSDIFP